jgi:hypothetical protein
MAELALERAKAGCGPENMAGAMKPRRAERINKLRDCTMEDPPAKEVRNWVPLCGAPAAVVAFTTCEEGNLMPPSAFEQHRCICNPWLPI